MSLDFIEKQSVPIRKRERKEVLYAPILTTASKDIYDGDAAFQILL